MRPKIVAFLRQNARNKAANDFVESLKPKYKFTLGKDINAPDLKPMESLFSINGSSVSAQQFDERFKADIYDARAAIAVPAYRRSGKRDFFDACRSGSKNAKCNFGRYYRQPR